MRDLPGWIKPAAIWGLLGVALFLGVQAWLHQRQATRVVADGGVVELRRGLDGHYHWRGHIGGQAVDFLVDTGATRSALPAPLARRLALPVVGQHQGQSAGGPVRGDVVLADLALEGGLRVQRLPLSALPDLATPLLGMDVLGALRWQQQGGVLRIELPGSG